MKRKKHTFRKIVLSVVLVALVAGLAALPLLTAGMGPEENKASILDDVAQRRDLSRVIAGGGALLMDYSSDVTLPAGIDVTRYLVKNGDEIKAGDTIALVDDVSVITAVKSVQETLDSLSKSIQTARGKIESGPITLDETGTLCVNGKPIEDSKLGDYSNYLTLSEQHRQYEELMLELFLLHQSGVITAPSDGLVQGLDDAMLKPLSASGSGQLMFLGVNTPGGSDDDTYFCQVYGVVSVDGSTMQVQTGSSQYNVNDLQNLTWVNWNPSGPISEMPAEPAAFVNNNGNWSVVTPQRGDILMYAFGSSHGWILKIGTYTPPAAQSSQTGGNTGGFNGFPGLTPEKPEEGEEKEDSSEESTTEKPTNRPSSGTGGFSGFGGMGGVDLSQFAGGRGGSGAASTAASLHSTERTTLCTLTPMEKMYLSLNVDETDISCLHVGMEAQVSLDALPHESYSAVILSISPFGTNSGGSSKFAVELELDRAEKMLPGMNAAVTLTVEQLEDVLTVPVAALVDQGTKTVIYTALDEKTGELASPVPVELGFSNGEYVQILSGLKDGQSIHYSYYDTVEISYAVETRNPFQQ